MRKMVLVVLLLGVIVSQVPYVSGNTIKSGEIIQDTQFAQHFRYWNWQKSAGFTQSLTYSWQNPGVNISADVRPSGHGSGEFWQTFSIPKVNVLNATLTAKVNLFYGNSRVILQLNNASGKVFYTSENTLGIYTINRNVTGIIQDYEGKNLTVKIGMLFWDYSQNESYRAELRIYYVELNIQYTEASSGSSGSSSSSSSSSGGSWRNGRTWFGGGGLWFGNRSANQTYIEFIAANIQRLLAIGAGAVVSILWVKVGMDYFSRDPDKRMRLKGDTLLAIVGTLVIALAVLGAIWMIAGWVVGGG